MKKIRKLIYSAATTEKFWYYFIFAVTFAVFVPALAGTELLSDSVFYFLNVRSIGGSLKHCFDPVLELTTPLTGLSLYLNYLTGGEEHFVLHARLTNILLHCGSALLFFTLLRQLRFGERDLPPVWAGVTALVFAIHPQRVESVVWVAERKDCLAMILGLAALLLFFCAMKKNRISILSFLLLVLSIAAKPMWLFFFVPAAALMWCHFRTFSFKKFLKFLFPAIAVSIGTLAMHFVSVANAIQHISENKISIPFLLKSEIICHNYGSYFLKTFFPGELMPLYPYYTPEGIHRVIALLPLVFLVLVPFLYKKHRAVFLYGILPVFLCYIASLLPVAGFVRIGNADFADRYSYMPSLFLLTGAMFFLAFCVEKASAVPKFLPAAAGTYCIVLMLQTFFYIPVWNGFESMNEQSWSPQFPNPSAAIVHAAELYGKNDFDGMFKYLNTRLPERPHYTEALNHMIRLFKISATGLAFIKSGRTEEGIRHLKIVYSVKGNGVIKNFPIHFLHEIFNVGANYYLKQKQDPATAAAIYKGGARILSLQSIQFEPYYNGLAALILKDYDQAMRFFGECLALAPGEPEYMKKYEESQKLKIRKK